MRTTQIELPEDIERQLSMLNENQQDFILDAVREKIKKKAAAAAEVLKKKLAEGYQATYEEDLNVTSDFESADLEDCK